MSRQIYEYLVKNPERVATTRAEFLRQALTTARADREKLAYAVEGICTSKGAPAPSLFLWFDSPPVAVAALQLLRELYRMQPIQLLVPSLKDMVLRNELIARPELATFDVRFWMEAQIWNAITLFDFDAVEHNRRLWNDLSDFWLMFIPYKSSPRVFRMETLESAAVALTEQLTKGGNRLSRNSPLHGADVTKHLKRRETVSTLYNRARAGGGWLIEAANKLSSPIMRGDPQQRRLNFPFRPFQDVSANQVVTNDSRIAQGINWRNEFETPVRQCHAPLLDVADLLLLRQFQEAEMRPADKGRAFFDAFDAGGWWWVLDDICVAVDNPLSIHIANGVVHHDTEAALTYPGWEVFSLRGIAVPEKVLRNQFSFEDIRAETNIEVRRIMIERFGLGNFIHRIGAIEVHRDECGILYRAEIDGDEPLVIVQVENKTPEPDGTFRTYHLRVPPNMERARQAVAWTFGLRETGYNPITES